MTQEEAVSRKAVKEIICAEFVDTQDGMSEWRNAVNDVVENILDKVEELPFITVVRQFESKKQVMPMSCDDCCYEPNSPFCEMYRKDICEKKNERQKGEWEEHTDYYKCPFCNDIWNGYENEVFLFNFCPNCGADLREESHE